MNAYELKEDLISRLCVCTNELTDSWEKIKLIENYIYFLKAQYIINLWQVPMTNKGRKVAKKMLKM